MPFPTTPAAPSPAAAAPAPATAPTVPTACARSHFGLRLRHWRETRGLSQAELGRRLGYDDSLISRVENARRWPPPDLPARADELLDTGHELARLWPTVAQQRRRLDQLSGRTRPAPATHPGTRPGATALDVHGQLLTAYRAAASRIGGQDLVTVLEHHTRTLAGWQRTAPRGVLPPLRSLAARYAELAGWARFDTGATAEALAWYDVGLDWALAGGDHATAAALRARQSVLHWAAGDAAAALALAADARRAARALPGTQAWAAVAQAYGHALAGEARAALRALEEAEHLAEDAVRAGERASWLARAELVLTVARGTCHRDLAVRTGRRGHARAAVAHLGAALELLDAAPPASATAAPTTAAVPVTAAAPAAPAASVGQASGHPHDRALVAARLAGAHAWAGRPEAGADLLARDPAAGAGRVAAEQRQARRWLARWEGRPA